MLDPVKLQLLIRLDALGTMHAVAQSLYLSPSTVSQQLAALEHETGTQLFERVGRRVRLTPTGKELVHEARPILGSLQVLEEHLHNDRTEVRGTVRIAAFASALTALVLPAASAVRRTYPELSVMWEEVEPDTSLPMLDAGQFDLALAASFGQPRTLARDGRTITMLGTDQLRVVVSSEHHLSARRNIRLSELAKENWIFEPPNTYLARLCATLCENAGFAPIVTGIAMNHATIVRAVQANLAVAMLPQLAIDSRVSGVRALPLSPQSERSIVAVTTPSQLTRPAVRVLVDAMREHTHRGDGGR